MAKRRFRVFSPFFFNTTSMKVVLLETVLLEASVLCQPGHLGVKVYIGEKTFWVLPHCESNWRDYNCLQSYKMNEKFILTLIFSSVKVSGKTLYSFQCGVSFKPNKNYCKESTSCCGNRSFVFQKVRYGQQKGNLCKECLSLLLFLSKKYARNDSKILPQLIHCCRMLQLTSYKLDGALT